MQWTALKPRVISILKLSPNGLLYWGGHLAWDLEQDQPVTGRLHELEIHQPYFELMHRVAPAATGELMEAIWAGHVVDWALLDYNRHADINYNHTPGWNREFTTDVEVPFPTYRHNLSFCSVTITLAHAGVSLAMMDNHWQALTWTQRLLHRWQQARDPRTGLSGGQLSYDGEVDRAKIALGHIHPKINEAKIIAHYHQAFRYHFLPLAQMQAGERLMAAGGDTAKIGHQFITWASEDLLTYAEHCYDPESGMFNARMADGTPIHWREAKEGYYVPESFVPRPPDGYILWGYATAYRLTENGGHWTIIRRLCSEMGLGDLGLPGEPVLNELDLRTMNDNWGTIYAMLELFGATGRQDFLLMACRVADNLLERQTDNGLFPRPGRVYARTGDEIPLALMHLTSVIEGRRRNLPRPILDYSYFHAVVPRPICGLI